MSELHRKTINFTDPAHDDLEYAIAASRDSTTDTINKAVRVYAKILREAHGVPHRDLYIASAQEARDGDFIRILIL